MRTLATCWMLCILTPTVRARRRPRHKGVRDPRLVRNREEGPGGRREGARVPLPDQRAHQAIELTGLLQHGVHLKPEAR